jgi:hypothetical protein
MHSLPARILADALAPSVARWSESREWEILRTGQPLPPSLVDFAGELGILSPEDLRLELTDLVPLPLPNDCVALARAFRLPVFHPAGMCLGRGLSCTSREEALLRHELVHTLQYQRLNSHKTFMSQYLFECLHHGYALAPLEQEARALSTPS